MASTDIAAPHAAPGVRLVGWRGVVMMAVVVLVGFCARSVILSVPPVLPLIQHDLRLSYTATGLLSSLPVLVMGGAALPAGRLVGRYGGRVTVGLGLALITVGAVLRAVVPGVLPLYGFTFGLSLGIALTQTSVPVLARQWFPTRIGLVSALFTDGLILGETFAASLTVPLALGLFGPDAWAQSFIFWGAPVGLVLVLWLLLAPSAPATVPSATATAAIDASPASQGARQETTVSPAPPPRHRPRARVSGWHLGIMLGSGSLIYFGMNAWIAPYNLALGHGSATPLALGVLNVAQLPASLGITVFAQALAGRRWPFILAGALSFIAVIGWVAGPLAQQPLWAVLFGASSAAIFTLGFALPPLLAGDADVARVTAMTLTIGYGTAFLGPLLGGALWDLASEPALAFAPVAAAALMLIVLAARLPTRANFGFVARVD